MGLQEEKLGLQVMQEEENVITTLYDPEHPSIGVVISGEYYWDGPIIQLLQMEYENDKWVFVRKLKEIEFYNYDDAEIFVEDVADISPHNLLLLTM
ncbi:hypothetical protein AUO94_00440 [Planococcus kocurii]|uniref:DUF5348 domain-containing protein n=1 Tax=Planococcus kocurii TaxID=1374 RepID=A0ABN4JQN3_9BACL|nr:hypothetical protein [Planococcus kocurii]ALS77201.1 hypothetical protein AUO94_00440 [Planococcus kocurii]